MTHPTPSWKIWGQIASCTRLIIPLLREIKRERFLSMPRSVLPTKRKLRMATLKRCSNFPQNNLKRMKISPATCSSAHIRGLFLFSSIIRRDHQLDTLKQHSHEPDRHERPRRHHQKQPCPSHNHET